MPNPNTSSFPYTPATDAILTVASDNAHTTLGSDINTTVQSIAVVDTSNFAVPCLIVIDGEVILAGGKSGNTFTNCTRGFLSSTVVSHTSATDVYGYILAYHHNQLAAEVTAMSNYIIDSDLSGFKKSENLLTFSENFSNVYWSTSSGATVGVQPQGGWPLEYLVNGSPAYYLVEGASLGLNMISATPTGLVSGNSYVFSVYLKWDGNKQWVAIGQHLAGAGSEARLAWFDIANGVLGQVGSDAEAAIVSVGNGWYRCFVVTNCTSNFYQAFDICLSTGNGASLPYLGTSADNVLIAAAQVESGVLSGTMSYVKTNGTPFSFTNGGDLILDEGDLS